MTSEVTGSAPLPASSSTWRGASWQPRVNIARKASTSGANGSRARVSSAP